MKIQEYYWKIVDKATEQKQPGYISRAAASISRLTGASHDTLFEEAVKMSLEQNNLECAIRTLDAWQYARANAR